MKRRLFFLLSLLLPVFAPATLAAPADNAPFSFAVIDQPAVAGHFNIQVEIDRIRPQVLAFAVANGIRSENESCTDALYRERRSLLEESDKPLFLSLSGSDWIGCKNAEGEDIRTERLRRLREILFQDDHSFGMVEMPLTRQSRTARHQDYPENTYWTYGPVIFVTLNLPADNNHYLNAAGRNNEFEERLVANRYWLKRIFTIAQRDGLSGIVIFSDGNPFQPEKVQEGGQRDGFDEVRRQLSSLAGNFSGQVLVIYGDTKSAGMPVDWRGNTGRVAASPHWLEIRVQPGSRTLFSVGSRPEKR